MVEKFKDFNEYLNKLCDYYVEGFELFRKYLAKRHPKLDFTNLIWKLLKRRCYLIVSL